MLSIFVDNNAWDILFERNVDLGEALPKSEYRLAITREAEFEINMLPDEKLAYVRGNITSGEVRTDIYFGFSDGSPPGSPQRVGCFGEGRFISSAESAVLAAESGRVGSTQRPTGLYKNEADVSLAARSVHSILLTCDKKGILGRVEEKYGATVIDLSTWPEGLSLSDFIRGALKNESLGAATSSTKVRSAP